jgi:hypothetical protein
VARIANNKEHAASPESANMKTQLSPLTANLPVGLQNVNNASQFSKVISFLKF